MTKQKDCVFQSATMASFSFYTTLLIEYLAVTENMVVFHGSDMFGPNI